MSIRAAEVGLIKIDRCRGDNGSPAAVKNAPGAFTFMRHWKNDRIIGIRYICPCGCGTVGALPFETHLSGYDVWRWDGNKESPTLTPSIQRNTRCAWNGFLTAGKWMRV